MPASPRNPTAQLILELPGFEDPQPSLGIELDHPSEVDAAHAEATRRGLRVVYPITDEPWGSAASSSRIPAARSSMCSLTYGDEGHRCGPVQSIGSQVRGP